MLNGFTVFNGPGMLLPNILCFLLYFLSSRQIFCFLFCISFLVVNVPVVSLLNLQPVALPIQFTIIGNQIKLPIKVSNHMMLFVVIFCGYVFPRTVNKTKKAIILCIS